MITERLQNILAKAHLVAAACIVQSSIVIASAQLLVRPKASELPAIQQQLDPALLPSGATQLVVETSQIFQLAQEQPPATVIVPVHFKTAASGSEATDNCGIYLLPAAGKPTFQLLISETLVPQEQCFGGVEAVGAHLEPQQFKANVILIYKAKTPRGTAYRPTILRWSFDADAYILNPEGSHYLLEQDHVPTTVREVVRLWARAY